jgi:hypothetical protein
LYHCWTPERLEKKAGEILLKYKDGALLLKPQVMDVDHFAEFYCKATPTMPICPKEGLTLGLTCFHDGKIIVWDETRTKSYPLDVEKGYIFIDKAVLKGEILRAWCILLFRFKRVRSLQAKKLWFLACSSRRLRHRAGIRSISSGYGLHHLASRTRQIKIALP